MYAFEPKDITGDKVGRLTAIMPLYSTSDGWVWLIRCDCGNTLQSLVKRFNKETRMSCGCLKAELLSERSYKHGMQGHPSYGSWRSMKARCNNENHEAYKNYGGRGIEVCERWNDYINFWEDMGSSYVEGLTLDRIDNDGNYNPINCKWSSRREQQNNQRSNRKIESKYGTTTLAELSRVSGINKLTLRRRLDAGCVGEELLKPTGRAKKNANN